MSDRTWNHRVIEFVDIAGEPWRAIHEVHYNEDGTPAFYTENPAAVMWDVDGGDPVAVLDQLRNALGLPVLVETDFRVIVIPPHGARGSEE